MKIAVYTICKDEKANVERWWKSCCNADYVIVADTGSTDGTLQEMKEFIGYNPFRVRIDPWRFDDAHNAALALVPGDADVCIPLHLDDTLEEGWREHLERKWIVGCHTAAFYTYQFSKEYSFLVNRIHQRRGYRWRYPAHEGVYAYGIHERQVEIPELRMISHATRSPDDGRLLRDYVLLKMGVTENPDSARMSFYYGRQLVYMGHYHEALHFLERYKTLKGTFAYEQEQVNNYIAQAKSALTGEGREG